MSRVFTLHCQRCGNAFASGHPGAKWCKPGCRKHDYRTRKRQPLPIAADAQLAITELAALIQHDNRQPSDSAMVVKAISQELSRTARRLSSLAAALSALA
jgi:hypothetical protein